MSAIYVLLIVSLLVAAGFLVAFLWSVNTGQYEDDYTPSVRILFDDPADDSTSGTEPSETASPPNDSNPHH